MVYLKKLSKYLTETNKWDTNFRKISKDEMLEICNIIIDSTIDEVIPYIKDECLIMPHNTHERFKWWAGGQSIKQTLEDLNATEDVKRRYYKYD